MRAIKFLFKFIFISGLLVLVAAAAAGTAAYMHFSKELPDVETLREIKFQTPLRIYSIDEKLIAEFGEKKRTPITYDEIPPTFVNALLAAEDSRFFNHGGIDVKGLARAAFQLATTGHIQSGGSTITMQVAKNFFLTRQKTFSRKFTEILLALRIEEELSKEEILELYVNKIYLGHRSYGIQAAANVYYGSPISELSTAQLAMIAGLPKAPSAYNPITNPSRALERRNWILQRMHGLSFINDQEYEEARNEPITASYHTADIEVEAGYVAEMVRAELFKQYGEDLYTEGFRVYTTIDSKLQSAANQSLQTGLLEYTERHGYRGPEQTLPADILNDGEATLAALKKISTINDLEPAAVLSTDNNGMVLLRKNGEQIVLPLERFSWAAKYIDANRTGAAPKKAADIVKAGDVVRIQQRNQPTGETYWALTQVPSAQGALISAHPANGAIQALVGGFNFHHNKFNRVTQAVRQPGSNIKPFVYTAALANGYTPASLINDAPVVFHDSQLEANWRPENYSKKFYGPTRLREALFKSRNLVSIRLLQSLGVDNTLNYLENFGFNKRDLPHNLSLALGSADMTPLQLITGYTTLANGGYRVTPYFIQRIENESGEQLFSASPATVCADCLYIDPSNPPATIEAGRELSSYPLAQRTIDEQSAYLIYSMMQDVIKQGTARRALALNRNDLAGKTGTTNDQKDAWFSGFNRDLATTVWIGFDQPETLGRKEFGGTAALPVWIDYMSVALEGKPENTPIPPEGIVSVKIDPTTGLLAAPDQANAIFEYFREEDAPVTQTTTPTTTKGRTTDELF